MRSSTLLVVGVALGGCIAFAARSARSDGDVDPMANTASVHSGVPPIDAKVPAKVETATFALG